MVVVCEFMCHVVLDDVGGCDVVDCEYDGFCFVWWGFGVCYV